MSFVRVILVVLLGVTGLLSPQQPGAAQPETLTVSQIYPATAAPGQLINVAIAGLNQITSASTVEVLLRVEVIQDGITYEPPIRHVAAMMLSTTRKGNDSKKIVSPLQLRQVVTFAMPSGTHAGTANIIVSFVDRHSSPLRFEVVDRPKPFLSAMTPGVGSLEIPERSSDLPKLKLERGSEVPVPVYPLVDTDEPANGIIVTFRQGGSNLESNAKVVYRDLEERVRGNTRTFTSGWVEARVRVPKGLGLGEASMEVRLRANGQLSEPLSVPVIIVDYVESPPGDSNIKPHIVGISAARIGAGQLLQLALDDRGSLEPEPGKAEIVLEQGHYRERLKPEMNSAALTARRERGLPAVLDVRLDTELRGEVLVRVLNPARGEEGGLSDGKPIELVDDVLPPAAVFARESTDQDLFPLRQMREIAIRNGHEFRDYNPTSRYVTISAKGLDTNPNYVRITFEQDGRVSTLSFADFSMTMGDLTIVRLPTIIHPGSAMITIQNKGRDRMSEPVSRTLEIAPR
jgi:hypothetical protein